MQEMRLPHWLAAAPDSPLPEALSYVPDTDKPVHIYMLVDPETDEIRYVGKSIRPAQRLLNHMNERSNTHRSHWLQTLRQKGLRPRMVILETIEGRWPWQDAERFWIAHLRSLGARLVNGTSGGDGVPNLSPDARERIRSAWVGRRHKPETIEKLRPISSTRRHSEATRRKMSRAQRGRVFAPAHLAKIAAANRKFSPVDEDAIRRRLLGGERVGALAAEYGVHRTTISKIKTGVYRGK